ncbi:uncharacterized protein Dvar_73130 [Desulfosarcina variabilis str. Montpellier]|jgi:hypothetical protein|uniref:hypothetical protein n=1 Tax=Desulfosarcina variabilis TaxID=2300 RepID=UPI003AFAAA59
MLDNARDIKAIATDYFATHALGADAQTRISLFLTTLKQAGADCKYETANRRRPFLRSAGSGVPGGNRCHWIAQPAGWLVAVWSVVIHFLSSNRR